MQRFLNSYVHVDGVAYPAGMSEAQVGAAAASIGDHAWTEAGSPEPASAPTVTEQAPTAVRVEVEPSMEEAPPPVPEVVSEASPAVEPAETVEVDESPAAEVEPTPPPQSGKGSSETAWRRYAKEVGVHVDDAEDRAQVIAAIEAAGKSV